MLVEYDRISGQVIIKGGENEKARVNNNGSSIVFNEIKRRSI